MSGVVAGSAIAMYSDCSSDLRLVALTVNNVCNLQCPHCYLQYDAPDHYIADDHIEHLLSEPFEHLAIVGKEPFVTPAVARRTVALAARAREAGKTVSAITNGFGLDFLHPDQLGPFAFIDVSFDGGAETYGRFRGASWSRLRQCLESVASSSVRLNALHTLYAENLPCIDDMLTVAELADFVQIIFSPYMETENEGINRVSKTPVTEILHALSISGAFVAERKARLLLDSYHLAPDGLSTVEAQELTARLGLDAKTHFVPFTPLQVGTVRVTYDGLVMAPAVALHTSRYGCESHQVLEESLATTYASLVSAERRAAVRSHQVSAH